MIQIKAVSLSSPFKIKQRVEVKGWDGVKNKSIAEYFYLLAMV